MNINQPLHLLLVDDREENLLSLESVLADPGYHLVKASSGPEALEKLNHHPNFAAIILDVQMPGMDGFQTAAEIKKIERLKSVPLIFVTAIDIDNVHIQRGYSAGAVDYIFKPFDPQILRAKVAVFAELFRQKLLIAKQANEIRIQEEKNREHLLSQLELENFRRYQNLADAVPLLIWKMGPTGKAEYFNKAWTNFTEMRIADSLDFGWRNAFEPEAIEKIQAVFTGFAGKTERIEMECLIQSTGGTKRWHLTTIVPEFTSDGRLIGWIGTSTDIHDQKTQADDLARSNAELEKFASIASHDLQEPLRTVSSFGSLLRDEFSNNLPEDGKEYIEFMVEGAKRMQDLVDDLLLYSSVGTHGKDFEPIDFNDLIKTPIENLRKSIEESSAEITVGPLPQIPVDKAQFIQVFQNLIGNAIKFRTNVSPKISISARMLTSEAWEFCVSDNGIGIDPKFASRIFEVFQRLHTHEEYPGSGIGLSICKKIVERHGGKIWIESAPGAGSKFYFTVLSHYLNKKSVPLRKAG